MTRYRITAHTTLHGTTYRVLRSSWRTLWLWRDVTGNGGRSLTSQAAARARVDQLKGLHDIVAKTTGSKNPFPEDGR